MDCFYIITNKLKDPDFAITNEIKRYIESKGKVCYISEKDSEGHIIPGTVPDNAQCGLVLGGDGTLIRAVRDLGTDSLPLLGINLGTLGYLTDVELKDFKHALDCLFEGEPDIEERMMLEGSFRGLRKDIAMNDIVLAREGKVRPVVEPTARMIVITPICSHALNTSSVVLSADDTIEVEICEGRYGRQEQVSLCFDGAEQTTLVTGERVCIKEAAQTARLIKLNRESFMITMRRKMKGN